MLRELYIENLAVIEKAAISLGEGLNTFTGETGAGKSILIGGINAILGQRVTKDLVRTGADRAVISGLFTDLDDEVEQRLAELGIQCEEGQLTLTREIRSDGGSIARIDQRAVNVSLLREIGELLVNIHGQHDNQILMSSEKHIDILDGFAESQELLEDYRRSFRALQSCAKKINRIKAEAGRKQERIAQLRETVEEITLLDITDPQEEESVRQELELSANAVAVSEAVYAAGMMLSGNDDTEGAAQTVEESAQKLEEYTEIMPELSPLYERLSSAAIELEDVAGELAALLSKLEIDPKRYDWLNRRSDDLRKICKKYGPELRDVMQTQENAQKELEELDISEQDMKELMDQRQQLLTEVSRKAKALSDHRRAAAQRFVAQVTRELEFLNMPKVRLVVDIQEGKLTISGMDTVEFLISANVGEEPRPIAKIASGGELSRIMLALKNVIAEKDSIPTLIFDEIDTGVSGRAAQKIGMKLRQISRIRQVLCVTHLAQIAVMADDHLLIEKNVVGERTVTTVKKLDSEDRKREIARIMGGDNITELMLENAAQLLESAKDQ